MMGRFLLKIFILVLAVFITDRVLGIILQKTCSYGKVNYISDYCNADILIFGSSRAEQHYNTPMMEDSLKMTAFNCGAGGYGIINSYGYLKMIQRRYIPKIIIYDVTYGFDFTERDNHRFIRLLKTQYEKDDIKNLILRVDPNERYKMMSYLYRYNSNWIHEPERYLQHGLDKTSIQKRGYKAMDGTIKIGASKSKRKTISQSFPIDTLKMNFFKDFIASIDTNQTTVIAVISPVWRETSRERVAKVKSFFDNLQVPFYDFSDDPKYYQNNHYFYNSIHLNSDGADEYTKDIIRLLRDLGKDQTYNESDD